MALSFRFLAQLGRKRADGIALSPIMAQITPPNRSNTGYLSAIPPEQQIQCRQSRRFVRFLPPDLTRGKGQGAILLNTVFHVFLSLLRLHGFLEKLI